MTRHLFFAALIAAPACLEPRPGMVRRDGRTIDAAETTDEIVRVDDVAEANHGRDGHDARNVADIADCGRRGMTWTLQTTDPEAGVQRVGCWGDGGCDAYSGDTPCGEARPVLCFRGAGAPQPSGRAIAEPDHWSGGRIALTEPVVGCALASLAAADARCADRFGAGFRMAEFHDGWGWFLWAHGTIAAEQRFWVFIDDQPANCFPTQ